MNQFYPRNDPEGRDASGRGKTALVCIGLVALLVVLWAARHVLADGSLPILRNLGRETLDTWARNLSVVNNIILVLVPCLIMASWVRSPARAALRRNAGVVCGGLILLEALSWLLSILLVLGMQLLLPPSGLMTFYEDYYQIISIIVYTLVFLIPILVMAGWIRIPARVAFPMRRVKPSFALPAVFLCLGVTVVGGMIGNFIRAIMEVFSGVTPVMPDTPTPRGLLDWALYFVSVAILPAILEEMMFRGVIMQSLRRFGDGFALVVSAVLFALCHGNLVQGPNALLMGLAIGYFVLRTGSLFMGMLIHFVNNGMAVLLEAAFYSDSEMVLILAGGAYYLMYIVLALLSLIFLVVRHRPNLFRVAPSDCPMWEWQKYLVFFTGATPVIYVTMCILTNLSAVE